MKWAVGWVVGHKVLLRMLRSLLLDTTAVCKEISHHVSDIEMRRHGDHKSAHTYFFAPKRFRFVRPDAPWQIWPTCRDCWWCFCCCSLPCSLFVPEVASGAAEVQHGHSSVARFLIDVGAKVDVPDLQGVTPLSCAAARLEGIGQGNSDGKRGWESGWTFRGHGPIHHCSI